MNKLSKLPNGVSLQIINDKKFKTASISVNFIAKLEKTFATYNSLVPYVLKRGFEDIKDTMELNKYLDELYGSKLACNISKCGNNQLISITGITVSDLYAGDDKPFAKLIKLIYDILYKPYIYNNGFDKLYVEREKENLKLFIEGIKNDKREYTRKRLIEEMYGNSPYSIYAYGDIETLKSINENNLYDYYESTFKKRLFSIVVAGSVNEDETTKVISSLFGNTEQNNCINPILTENTKEEAKEIIEPSDVTQSKLAIGYKTDVIKNSRLYFAMMMFDNLFGGSVHSKLFLNVREKLSLAYYAASRYNSLKGFVMVDSGIETKNFELARNEIEHQLNEMKKGNFSDQDIEYSKLAIINSYNSAKDSLASLLNYYSSAPLMETIYEIDEIISHIQAVTKDEIIEAANTVKYCTTFLLKGRE